MSGDHAVGILAADRKSGIIQMTRSALEHLGGDAVVDG